VAARSTQPPFGPAVNVVTKNDSPPSAARFNDFMTPPWALASICRSGVMAIIAPDSARIGSFGPRTHRATEKLGWWRS